MKKSRNALIVGIIAAVLVLAGVLALVLTKCTGGEAPATTTPVTEPTEAEGYTIYWNLDRAKYDGKSEAGMSSRQQESDGYFHIRFFVDGEVVTLKAADRKIVNSLEVQDVMGLTLDDSGIITEVIPLEELPCQSIAYKFYVKSAGGNLIKVNSSPKMNGMDLLIETNENTGVWDMTGLSGEPGCDAEPVPMDRLLAIADLDGNITHVFLFERENYMRTHEGECEHCGKTVTWGEWTRDAYLPTQTGHYQLMNDIQLVGINNLPEDAKVCVDLNGKTVTGKAGSRMYVTNKPSTELAIMDTSAEKTGRLVAHGKGTSSALCVWVRYGAFYLYDGILDASNAQSQASGITVNIAKNAYMYMHGGEVIGGTALYKYDKQTKKYSCGLAGSIYVAGKLVLNDGIIRDGYAQAAVSARNADGSPKSYQRGIGGNLVISGTMEMNGGTIKNGRSDSSGGNIYMDGTAEFIMNGGTITGGRTLGKNRSGGNLIGYSKVSVTISGGLISSGRSSYRGGNVYLTGKLRITGGAIRGGMLRDWKTGKELADQSSRNIFFSNNRMTLYGGNLDGGVQLLDSSAASYETSLVMIGYPYINSKTQPNLTITGGGSGVKVTVGKLHTGAMVGVNTALGIFTEPTSADNLDKFYSDIPGADVLYVDGRLGLGRLGCLCGSNSENVEDHLGDCKAAGIQTLFWGPVTSTTKLPTATGNYYLVGDVDAATQTSLAANADVKLDLNGYTINGPMNIRTISVHNPGAKLTLCDSSTAKTGTIRSQGVGSSQGNVVWTRYGSFDFYGGTLDGSAYTISDSWSAGTDGIFGTKDDYSSGRDGGTVAMGTGTAIRMFGGTIIGNSAKALPQTKTVTAADGTQKEVSYTTTCPDGPSLYVSAKSTFDMYDGEIRDGITEAYGGNVRVSGTMVIYNGRVADGVCAKNGGNVYVTGGGVLELRDGSIEGGWGKNISGNLHVTGKVIMSGGSITGGKCGKSASTTANHADISLVNGSLTLSGGTVGRIQALNYNIQGTEGGAEVILSGDPTVTALRLSTLDDIADDGKTPSMPIATIAGSVEKAKIGVLVVDSNKDFAVGQDYTVTNADGKAFTLSGTDLTAAADTATNSLFFGRMDCLCGKTAHTKGCLELWNGEARRWIPWTSTTTLPISGGNYYLTADVDLKDNGVQKLKTNANVALDLNGFTVYGKPNERMYATHNENSNMTITDKSAAQTGKMVGQGTEHINKSSCIWIRYGTFNLLGGTLDGSQAVMYNTWTTHEVERNGGVLCVEAGRNANIYGGTIIGVTAKATTADGHKLNAPSGASIWLNTGATLNMYGGTVKGGNTERYGGNIYLQDSTMNLFGGTVSGGTAANGGNIYCTGTLNILGGTIEGGTATQYGGNLRLKGTLNMDGGKIANGESTLNGGNICIDTGAAMTLSGGSVEGGWGKNITGNIQINGSLTMTGGTVTGGKSGKAGSATSAHADICVVNGSWSFSGGETGNVQVTNYNINGTEGGCNVNLGGGKLSSLKLVALDDKADDGKTPTVPVIAISAPVSSPVKLATSVIGTFAEGNGYTLTDADAAAFTANTIAPFPESDVIRTGNALALYGMDCLCGKTEHSKGCMDLWNGQRKVWTPWTSTTTLPTSGGNYYLTADVDLKDNGVQKLKANANVALDLNGFTVYGKPNERMYATHNENSNMTITDKSAAQTGKMVGQGTEHINKSCCIWIRYGTFNLLGGTLDGSQTVMYNTWTTYEVERNGGVLCVEKARTANIYGGTIIGVTAKPSTVDGHELNAPSGASIWLNTGATLNMYGGTVKGGNTERYGGNIYLQDSTMNLFGGTVTGGTAANGGNIYCTGTLNILGGTVEGGTATQYGGNIRATGTVNMDGGKLADGVATFSGGNICIDAGAVMNLSDGSVTGGWGKSSAGNIQLLGSLNMTGGTVTGGKAGKSGSATSDHADIQLVNGSMKLSGGETGYVQATNYNINGTEGGCSLELAGGKLQQVKLTVLDNKPDDGKIPAAPVITVSAPIASPMKVTTSQLGLFAEGKDYTLTDSDAANVTAATVSPYTGSAVERVDNTLVIYGMDCLCGKTEHTQGCMDLWNGEARVWKPWTSTTTLPVTGGNYYLTADVDLKDNGVQKLKANADVTLDLNGFTVTGKPNERMYATHNENSNMTITDKSAAQTGKMVGQGTEYNGKSCCIWIRYGTFNLLGGTLDGSQAVMYNTWTTYQVERNGGVLCLETGRTANIYGGTIIGATAKATTVDGHALYAPMGASIYIPSGATLNMYGGTVKDGSTEKYGGNIYLKGGTLNLFGGTIEGGEAKECAGNLFINGGTVNMTGGVIKNGTRGGSTSPTNANCAFINGGVLNISGGEIHGRLTTGSKVVSTDSGKGTVNVSGSAKIYYPSAANPLASNNLTTALTITVGKLNDDAMVGFQLSASVANPITSDKNNPKKLASYTDAASLQKALDEGRIGVSVYIASDTHKRSYKFVMTDGKLGVYQVSATPK